MRCPNFQRENVPTDHFCIYCGSILTVTEDEHTSDFNEENADIPTEHIQKLEQEIARLNTLITRMNDRLSALEGGQAIPASERIPEPAPIPGLEIEAAMPSREEPQITETAVSQPEVVPVVERWEAPITEK